MNEHIDDDKDDILTLEEEKQISYIQKASFAQEAEEVESNRVEKNKTSNPFGFLFSLFNGNNNNNNNNNKVTDNDFSNILAGAIGDAGTQKVIPFNIPRRLGFDKVVVINNISGKNAYVMLTSAPIKTLKILNLSGGALGFTGAVNTEFENHGDYKVQKLSIANNTSTECELDNSQFYCTLFLEIDGEWKKTWDNRRFNGKKFDINILERHVTSALDKNNIPDF